MVFYSIPSIQIHVPIIFCCALVSRHHSVRTMHWKKPTIFLLCLQGGIFYLTFIIQA